MTETDSPVLVAVSVDPETSHRANEAVRIALGILAGENEVAIAHRHLGTLKKLGQAFHVERSAMRSGDDWNPLDLELVPIDGA